MIKVGVVGGTGYTGVELLRLLAQHPDVELLAITSRGEAGMPVARFVAGAHEFPPRDAGIAEVEGATAEAPLFELLRGLTGRRSADQIRSWSWSTDPEPYLAGFAWGPFTMPTSDLPA